MDDPLLMDLPEEICSDRTVVRCYRPGDGAGMFEAIDESREHILPWMPWGAMHGAPADSERYVRNCGGLWTLRQDLPMGMFDKATGRFIGGCGFHRIDWNVRSFEIGYWVRKSAQGMGYVTDAVRLQTGYAFDNLNANRVLIRCSTKNFRSEAVARRAGYIHEGTLRNSFRDVDGVLHDTLVFSLVPTDWAALKDR